MSFFKDNKGEWSMTRLMSFMVILTACIYPFFVELNGSHVTLIIGMLTIGFGGKVVQKKLSEK